MEFRNISSNNVFELNRGTIGVKLCEVRLLANRLVSSFLSIFKRSMLKSPIKAHVLSSEAILSSSGSRISSFFDWLETWMSINAAYVLLIGKKLFL